MNIDKSHEITVKHSQMKVQVYNYFSDHHILTISETDLHCIIPLFHQFPV